VPNPLLIFRVGSMKRYDGPDDISGGGSYIDEYGEGGEMWNFLAEAGRCYGYVMTRHFAGIDLNRLSKKGAGKWRLNDELDKVDVIFIAKPTGKNQSVVGWYKDATIFHKIYRKRPNPYKFKVWVELGYVCEVDAENAVLLPEERRRFVVPFAPIHGAGYPGHANVWYGIGDTMRGARLIKELRNYIGSEKASAVLISANTAKRKGHGGWPAPLDDKATILQIEKNSMEATKRHFRSEGFHVQEVHRDYCGWDLTASKGRKVLNLEVKGHLGDVIHFELTPDEYQKMREMHATYRVCVVRHAMKSRVVEVYMPKHAGANVWQLTNVNSGGVMDLGEHVAARASERV
jgi:hypothetical protein